ncbi:DNA sulfur modification protein DndB [Sphingobium lignivorans]|uniref:DNA sulfur modification protein DndB n=1 Tax=Sphingobium lignivorans TaxID=2735886 RepID=A0ABR6NKS3_9SPHN|nr:DNA sulfur modification protein DndB [Sphingobium lignivorans]MBB5987866.1 DNA sulfur modification protein DndB [Sphingobium lignivorans]
MMLEFPAVRGIQAGREYYVAMCPLSIVHKLFLFTDAALDPTLRAQRQLNRGRLPEMVRYLVENRDSYVFSALTASIDGEAKFTPTEGANGQLGVLRVPMASRIIINDGQHRQAAIQAALAEAPELGDETIAVVLFHDRGLERCQQMFADLNRYAVRPSRSLSVLYDHRDDQALLAKLVLSQLPEMAELVEMERSSLSPRSKPLFTLSAIYTATAALLSDLEIEGSEERAAAAARFWGKVASQFPQWEEVRRGELTAGAVRDGFIHSHGVVLHALGRVGNALLKRKPEKQDRLNRLASLDWRREAPIWDGRAIVAGRLAKNHQSVILTANVIKSHFGLALTAEEQTLEDAFGREARAA